MVFNNIGHIKKRIEVWKRGEDSAIIVIQEEHTGKIVQWTFGNVERCELQKKDKKCSHWK